jgi:hypothetical protein
MYINLLLLQLQAKKNTENEIMNTIKEEERITLAIHNHLCLSII